MATYQELFEVISGYTLADRVAVAVVAQSEVIRTELTSVTDHDKRLVWAKQAISDPREMARKMLPIVVVQNQSATKAQILAATDAQLLTAVANAVPVFATGS